ncbi:MAG TPA: cell division protein FtsA [Spirochaetia bacterium]|nr:cell division protein FtsA [Spirochaetales bacterium]HRY72246.1 cell division protein FtsA [Spirochaetia bacterium]
MADNLIVGLDVGTAQTRAVIGEYNENGVLEITGVGTAPSTGLRRGVVVNIEATLASVAAAIEAAELMSGREAKDCFVGVAGANIEGINSRGVVAVTGKGREITQSDVDRVIEAARAVVIPMDREVLHVIPQTFIVDDQKGIRNPLDMIGVRLEAEVHIITGSVTTAQNLVKCVNRAGFKVERLILQSLAAARATLTSDEKELGCLLVDLGAGTTDLLVYSDGAPYFTSVIPVGGAQVTNDLSIMLSVPMDAAERLKREAASAWLEGVDPEESVVVPGVGGRPPVEISRRKLCTIAQPRMEEILRMARERVEKMGHWRHIKGGAVLTGGGALMQGAAELAQEIFEMPVRVGNPITVGGLVEEYRSPVYATGVGLVLLGAESIAPERRAEAARTEKAKGPSLGKIFDWLKNGFF